MSTIQSHASYTVPNFFLLTTSLLPPKSKVWDRFDFEVPASITRRSAFIETMILKENNNTFTDSVNMSSPTHPG
jgi:hypothetical protein